MSIDLNTVAAPMPTTDSVPPPNEKRLLKLAVRLLMVAGLVIVVVVAWGLYNRAAAGHRLEESALAGAAYKVAVVHPQRSAKVEELVLPAAVQAFIEAPIYARTQGYLKKWYFDIGSRVKRGQLLAEIETPEGDQQLLQARADLKAAQANAELAGSTAERWQSLLKKNAVSQQEADQTASDYRAKQAAVDAAAANVARLAQLQDFEKVYAPFDGLITARQTDIGALIASGSSPKELFHLAATDQVRVFTAVPETSASGIQAGSDATLVSDQFPTKVFHGTIARSSGAIDPSTRTLNVEVDIDNPSGELLPGSYGYLHLPLAGTLAPLTIPANALVFRSAGVQVAVVRGGKAYLVPITIGRDFGDSLEATSGLGTSDVVIVDPPDSLSDGAPVEVEKGL
jgi:RND family efflux transporter MFP subunit